MGIQAGNQGLGSRDLANRPKRGIVWLVVFFTAFVAVSYLIRQRDDPGLNRPEVAQQEEGDRSGVGESQEVRDADDSNESDSNNSSSNRSSSDSAGTESDAATDSASEAAPSESSSGNPSGRSASPTPTHTASETTQENSPADDLGALEEVGRDVWRSPAGLLYKPGSAEGHRLKHLARHLEDDPARPVHGVFLEPMPQVIQWIDQAYRWSEENDRRVTVRQERGRTVVIARFDAPIGYVGGERGADDDYPRVRRLQLILEDQDVITAYPIQ